MAATRRPIALAAAVATAAAVGATVLTLPASAAPAAPGAPQLELKDGTLDWGFKESFRKYLASPFSGGRITVAEGARQAAGNGVFTFVDGVGTYDTTTHGTQTAFKGSVHFTAHDGVLDITMSDLKISTAGRTGAITADIRSKPQGGTEFVTQNDVRLAALDLSAVKPGQGAGGAMVFKDIPATLTKEGSTAFNGQYKEGDKLDAATLSVKAAGGGEPTKPPTTKPPVDPTKPPVDPTKPPATKPPVEPTTPAPTTPAPTTPAPTAPVTPPVGADRGAIVDGNLDWGVLERFRKYVTGPIAHGRIELSGGAVKSGDGFRFPKGKGSFDAEKQNLSASFDGKVRFLGHEENGAFTLDLNLSALKVEVKNGKGTLTADVSTKDRTTKKVETYRALDIASLTPSGELAVVDGVVKLSGVPAKLTAGGVKAFGGMYEPGQALDALTVAVSVDKNAQLPEGGAVGGGSAGGSAGGSTAGGTDAGSTTGGTSVGGGTVGGAGDGTSVGGPVGGNLAATGSSTPSGALMGAAGALALAGGAVVFAAKRRRTANGA
ncbi:HtaA domain-containing protein [Streptomyces sp. NPDC004111]|uniref:HtaA domain-containing protein n=1 Tax=Streptomyces sp. NPDC004111 TaxID=3364690 RepID=UPI003697E1E9